MKRWLFILGIAVTLTATHSHGQAAEGAIAGRIQDSNGQALVGARVTLLGIGFYGKQDLYSAGFSNTNEIGEYRILRVPPGKYYVRISRSPESKPNGPSGIISSTYYPGANDMQHAKTVVLEQGQKATGIDFQVKPLPIGVTVSGTVVNRETGGEPLPGGRVRRNVEMYLIPIQDGPAELAYLKPAQSASNDETNFPFEIDGVPPGTYDFCATFADNTSFGEPDPSRIKIRFGDNAKTRYFLASMRIVVAQQSISGLTVSLRKGPEIHGHLSFRGEVVYDSGKGFTASGPNAVLFRSMTNGRALLSGSMEDDDRFTLSGLLPGNYQLTSISLLRDIQFIDAAYLADLRQDGRSVFNDGIIKVEDSSVNVELVIYQNGGRIHGSVEIPHDDHHVSHTVMLVPDSPRRGNRVLYKFTSPDERGDFTFHGVAPGSYKTFVFDGVPKPEEENPELIRLYEQRGITVTVKAGIETQSKPVPIIRIAQ